MLQSNAYARPWKPRTDWCKVCEASGIVAPLKVYHTDNNGHTKTQHRKCSRCGRTPPKRSVPAPRAV